MSVIKLGRIFLCPKISVPGLHIARAIVEPGFHFVIHYCQVWFEIGVAILHTKIECKVCSQTLKKIVFENVLVGGEVLGHT